MMTERTILTLMEQCAAHYDAASFSYLSKDLIKVAILALENQNVLDAANTEYMSAICNTLELAKNLLPDEFAYVALYGTK